MWTLHSLAYDYPLLAVFWTTLVAFILIAWCVAVFGLLLDVFRSRDLSPWRRAGWVLLVIVLPLLGVAVYLIVRGDQMTQQLRELDPRDQGEPPFLGFA
jgi:membrane protease YdiL (CAAX protease family)